VTWQDALPERALFSFQQTITFLMQDIVPRAAYDLDEAGYWKRLPWVAGIYFGTDEQWQVIQPLLPRRKMGKAGARKFCEQAPPSSYEQVGVRQAQAIARSSRICNIAHADYMARLHRKASCFGGE